MTLKTNKKYFICATAILAITVAGVFIFTAMTPKMNTMNGEHIGSTVVEPENVIHPKDLPRQGMAFLVSYPLAIQPEKYHLIDGVKQPWLVNIIEKGEAPINEKHLNEYFTMTEDGNYNFGLTVDGTTKYFEIEFYENPITSPTSSYVKAYGIFDDSAQFEKIDLKLKPKLKKIFDDEFSWVEVDEETAKELKLLMKDKKRNFEVDKDDGPAKYNLRYFGSYFETTGDN